jgi:hypothetical protein
LVNSQAPEADVRERVSHLFSLRGIPERGDIVAVVDLAAMPGDRRADDGGQSRVGSCRRDGEMCALAAATPTPRTTQSDGAWDRGATRASMRAAFARVDRAVRLGRPPEAAYPRRMPLVSSVRSAYRKLLGRPLIDAKRLDDAKRDPKYYATDTHVNVDRDFKKPRP